MNSTKLFLSKATPSITDSIRSLSYLNTHNISNPSIVHLKNSPVQQVRRVSHSTCAANSRILRSHKYARLSRQHLSTENAEVTLLPRARRAFMYVPGDSEKMISKASQLKVDSVCLDMEDGVADSSKDKARDQIVHTLDNVVFQPNVDVCVRVNPVSSPRAEKDLDAVFGAENAPQSICVPKIETQGEVHWLMNKLYGLAVNRPPNYKAHIVLICETPRAILHLESICNELSELSTHLNCNLVPDSVIFGSDDFCASVGATRSEDATEVLYARQKLLMVAKMFSLQAIDMVYNDLSNPDGLIKSCTEGKQMGFNGKQVINPKQIETVQSCYSPTPEQLQWAAELVTEWEQQSSQGVGAILFQGKMVDRPLVNQARNILRVKQKMNL